MFPNFTVNNVSDFFLNFIEFVSRVFNRIDQYVEFEVRIFFVFEKKLRIFFCVCFELKKDLNNMEAALC